jgi:hypothetical protein
MYSLQYLKYVSLQTNYISHGTTEGSRRFSKPEKMYQQCRPGIRPVILLLLYFDATAFEKAAAYFQTLPIFHGTYIPYGRVKSNVLYTIVYVNFWVFYVHSVNIN